MYKKSRDLVDWSVKEILREICKSQDRASSTKKRVF